MSYFYVRKTIIRTFNITGDLIILFRFIKKATPLTLCDLITSSSNTPLSTGVCLQNNSCILFSVLPSLMWLPIKHKWD